MLVFRGLLLLLGILSLSSSATTEDSLIIPLPRALYPTSYDLSVEVLLPPFDTGIGNVTFQNHGVVTVELNVVEETDKIVLNAANITIIDCQLVNINEMNASTELTNINYNVSSQLVTIMSPFKFAINDTLQLKIDYTFIIRNDFCGLFYTPYQEGNVTHSVVQTDFEAINARRLVPCFDEPFFRSKWTVEVKAPVGYTVLSNTEQASDPIPAGPGFTLTRFKPTPSIPSYLLAIAVHDYPYLENVTSTGIQYRFYGQQSKLDVCLETFEFTGRLIDQLTERFKIVKFLSSKVDFIETERHPAGGMENIGLITINSNYFCNVTYMYEFKRFIIHELVHQWFGNLVTMKDWSNAVMSEGITDYYTELILKEKWGVGSAAPSSFQLWKYGEMPLVKEPKLMKKMTTIVGDHLYQKGRFAFTMLEKLIGRTNFDNVSNTYLEQNAYGWGTVDMFLALADEQSSNLSLPVSKIMKPYFTEVGFPVVFVEKHPGYFNVTPMYANDNSAFNTSTFIKEKKDFYVPIWYRAVDEEAETLVVAEVGKSFNIISNATAVFIDPSGTSLHRTVYTDDLVFAVWDSFTNYTNNMREFRKNFETEFCLQVIDDFPNSDNSGSKTMCIQYLERF